MNRRRAVSVNHFPLTPALSLGERERQGPACDAAESVGFVGRQQRFMVPMRVEKTSRLSMDCHGKRPPLPGPSPAEAAEEEAEKRGYRCSPARRSAS